MTLRYTDCKMGKGGADADADGADTKDDYAVGDPASYEKLAEIRNSEVRICERLISLVDY